MPRTPPTPPAALSLPLFTIDGLVALFLRPVTNPLFTLLPPLLILALNPNPHSTAFSYACYFSISALLFQALSYFDSRVAGGLGRDLDWTKEVVLITGGAGGLGRVLAEFYGSIRRATTIVVDVLPATVERLNEWEALGCSYYQCDISDVEAVNKLRDGLARDVGKVSILVLAAGIVNSTSILNLRKDEVERCIGVNLMGAIWSIKAFLPGMLSVAAAESAVGTEEDNFSSEESAQAKGGTIVTVSSVLGYLGAAGLADYTATKAALTAFHESLRAELSMYKSNMAPPPRVNTILATPGQLSTNLFAHVPSPPLASFLGPTVTPAALGAMIIRAVDEGKDAHLSPPLYTQWTGILRLLPMGLAKSLRVAVGLDWAGWQGTINKARRNQ